MLVDSNESPSSSLTAVLAPEIRVKRVVFQGIGQCEDMNRSIVPKVFTEKPKENRPPVPRNQVDHVNATVGQLLVFKVPEVCKLYQFLIRVDVDNMYNYFNYFCRTHFLILKTVRREI